MYVHKATFLSLAKTACSTATSFQEFVSMFISLPFGTSLTFLLGLLSVVLIAVAFRHLATNHHSIVLAFIFILLFSHAMAFAVSPLLFSLLGLPCRSSFLAAIFIAMPFSSLPYSLSLFSQTAIIMAFRSRLDLSFVGLPLLLWSCCHHNILLLKTLLL